MSKKKSVLSFIIIIFTLWSSLLYAQNRDASHDIILQLLTEELTENESTFRKNKESLYLLSYRVEETETYEISSLLGNLTNSEHQRSRFLTIQIRIGTFQLDNYHFHNIRKEKRIILPIENDIDALKKIIHFETKLAYDDAIREYYETVVKAAFTIQSEEKIPKNLTIEKYYEEPTEKMTIDRNLWQNKIRSYSLPFVQSTEIISGVAEFQYIKTRKYFVSTEGASIAENSNYVHLSLQANAQAEDGMFIPCNEDWFCFQPEELPSDEEILQKCQEMKSLIRSLRNAPVADSYTGPILLSPKAAAQYCRQFTTSCFQVFPNENHYRHTKGEKIADTLFSFYVDPTQEYFNSIPLIGGYLFDDEGIRGDKTHLIRNGNIENLLTTRNSAVKELKTSGHSRAEKGFQPSAQISNLIFSSNKTYPEEELRQLLIKEAKAQGKAYGYLILSYEKCSHTDNYNKLIAYKVYVDGRPDILVRGLDWSATPLASIAQIEAAGNNTHPYSDLITTPSGQIPVSYSIPSLLIKHLELQKIYNFQVLPPITERPEQAHTEFTEFDKIAFKAVQEAIHNNSINLNVKGLTNSYHFNYLISDAQIIGVAATCGSILFSYEKPLRKCNPEILIGNDNCNNRSVYPFPKRKLGDESIMPIDNDYTGICHSLWVTTFDAFQNAEEEYQKRVQYEKLNRNRKTILKDQTPIDIQKYPDLSPPKENSISLIENAVRELSRIFIPYPEIDNSRVEAYSYNAEILFLNSEGSQYKQSLDIICLTVYAESRDKNGEYIFDSETFYFTAGEPLSQLSEMQTKVIAMIKRLKEKQNGTVLGESYTGPVLFIDEAVADLFSAVFIEGDESLLAYRYFIEKDETIVEKRNPLNSLIGKNIISNKLSITCNDQTDNFNGLTLIGSYQIDADGVKTFSPFSLIHNGQLTNLLTTRTETEACKESNGHQRLAISEGGVVPSQCAGVISMRSNSTVSFNKMTKKLLKSAKKAGKAYAYIITKIINKPYSKTGNDEDKEIASIYRIDIKSGKVEWIKNATLAEITIRHFENIEYVSSEIEGYNRLVTGRSKWAIKGIEEFPMNGVGVSYLLPRGIILNNIYIK